MPDIKIFNYAGAEIRTVTVEGEPWFVGKDVAEVLGYANTKDALSAHVDLEDKYLIQRSENATFDIPNRGLTIINESGLYSLILQSKLPTAKQFKRWVTSEVLPAIRKTGGYVNNDELFLNTYLPNADEATRTMFRTTLETVRSLNARIEADKPKVLFADAVAASHTSILIGDLAKLLRQNGVEMGQNRLFDWMRKNGYLCSGGSRHNMPTQRSMELGLFEVKESTVGNPDGSVRIVRTTKVSGKGQAHFINRFLGERR